MRDLERIPSKNHIFLFLIFFFMGDTITTYVGVQKGSLIELNLIINYIGVLEKGFIIFALYKGLISVSMIFLAREYKLFKVIFSFYFFVGIFATFYNSLLLMRDTTTVNLSMIIVNQLDVTTSFFIGLIISLSSIIFLIIYLFSNVDEKKRESV